MRLRNRVKLIPAVNNRFGAVFLNQKYRSKSFSIDMTLKINSSHQTSDGFAFWYLHQYPVFDKASTRIHGVSYDTNGLGVMVFKDTDDKWKVVSNYDRGGGSSFIENEPLNAGNSCVLSENPTYQPLRMRIEKFNNKFRVTVVETGNVFRKCIEYISPMLQYQGYIGITSSNQGNTINDIEINKMMIEDLDNNSVYLSAEYDGADVRYVDMRDPENANPNTARDILHTRGINVGKNPDAPPPGKVIEFSDNDDTEQILYKFWKSLRLYNLNLVTMLKTLRDYEKEEEEIQSDFATNPNLPQLLADLENSKNTIDIIGNSIVDMNDTLTFLASQVSMSKNVMTNDEVQYTDNLISSINSLNERLNNIESKMKNYIKASSNTINRSLQPLQAIFNF